MPTTAKISTTSETPSTPKTPPASEKPTLIESSQGSGATSPLIEISTTFHHSSTTAPREQSTKPITTHLQRNSTLLAFTSMEEFTNQATVTASEFHLDQGIPNSVNGVSNKIIFAKKLTGQQIKTDHYPTCK